MRRPLLLGTALTVGTLAAFGAVATGLVVRNLYFPGPLYAEDVLLGSVPSAYASPGQFIGLEHFTADVLNRTQPAAQWGQIDYVPAAVPSTRPNMVSVNPIDNYTWGAAAFSVRTSRCYLILTLIDPTDTSYGKDLYGVLSIGALCSGSAATPANVTMATEPPE